MRKQKQLLDVRYVLPMLDGSGSNLDLVEFEVSADKSSTWSKNKGFPLTQLPAERCPARRPLPYELIIFYLLFLHNYDEYSSFHPMTFQNV